MSEYEVGEIPPEQLEKQAKRYGLEDFVKGRVDNETLDRIARKADELQRENLGEQDKTAAIRKEVIRLSQIKLSDWDKKVADKAAKLIARDYGETLKKLADS